MPEAVLNAYNQLDAQSQLSVMDYINFLLTKVKPAEKQGKPLFRIDETADELESELAVMADFRKKKCS